MSRPPTTRLIKSLLTTSISICSSAASDDDGVEKQNVIMNNNNNSSNRNSSCDNNRKKDGVLLFNGIDTTTRTNNYGQRPNINVSNIYPQYATKNGELSYLRSSSMSMSINNPDTLTEPYLEMEKHDDIDRKSVV